MFGCETVLFSETKISELETIQSQVAKQILGVSKNTSNICAQTELGFKPIRLVLALCQLQFYFRVLRLPDSRWVKIALLNHLTGTWHSPYLAYITKLRTATSLYEAPPSLLHLRRHLFQWALFQTNSALHSSHLNHIQPLFSFQKALYVCLSKHLNVIASFKFLNAHLGNKAPLTGLPSVPNSNAQQRGASVVCLSICSKYSSSDRPQHIQDTLCLLWISNSKDVRTVCQWERCIRPACNSRGIP